MRRYLVGRHPAGRVHAADELRCPGEVPVEPHPAVPADAQAVGVHPDVEAAPLGIGEHGQLVGPAQHDPGPA